MTADLARMYAVERERRASAEALATRERELSAAKEFWTNTLVHDLKGPLTLISGWSELLEQGHQGRLDPAQAQAIQHIKQATSALDDLVLDINDSFRLGADALPIHRGPVAPAMLLRRVVDDYRGLDRAVPDLQMRGDLAPVQADARLICRVLRNLIGNAYKHAGASAQVALVAEPTKEGVLFAVDDDGPGIPEVDRERVFERFIQGHGARRGSGLGLAFCKLVVDQLGGRIWADASPLGGTRVAFLLPHARAERSTRIQPGGGDRDVSRVA
jgi:signal transduction histidine kinase